MKTNSDTIKRQASLYWFDLQNLAAEHGRMASDDWHIQQATAEEKAELEKQYQYTLSNKVHIEELPELLRLIQQRLNITPVKEKATDLLIVKENAPYLVAYHKDRPKK